MKNEHSFIKPRAGDIIIVCVLLVISIVIAAINGGNKKNAVAIIMVEGNTEQTIKLSDVKEPYSITTKNGVVLYVEKNAISVKSSPCKGQDCVHCGKLTLPGDIAVCAPLRTAVQIKGIKDGVPDAISY